MLIRVFIQIHRIVYIFIVLTFAAMTTQLHAQVNHDELQPDMYIPLTTFEYGSAPISISGPVNVLIVGEDALRVYFDLENSGNSGIKELQVWLMVYYHDRTEPVLFERTFSTLIQPGVTNSFTWEIPTEDFGEPKDGVIVPYRIEFVDDTVWNLNEFYQANVKNNNEQPDRIDFPSGVNSSPGTEPAFTGKSINAVQVSSPINVDGVLDENAWRSADPATGFLQSEPTEGLDATENTEVYVLYDEKNLYIGANLYDSNPDGVLGYLKKRDVNISSDDRFMWIIDTFLDGRTGYYFETNPAGLLGDGLIGSTGGRGGGVGSSVLVLGGGGVSPGGLILGVGYVNKSWDGIWTVETSLHEKGWTAEIRIPFQTLNFDPASDVWGINFQRSIRRKSEESRWSGHKRNQLLTSPVHAGRLNGLQDLSQGVGLEIIPYATIGRQNVPNVIEEGVLLQNPEDQSETPSDVGIDISYNITSSLRGAVSINTDFAEVEVDQRRINLTRFPLFFQEKRDFFLEGSSVFSFAPLNGVNPYFSRRIGLSEGVQIPIVFGARLGGTIGRNEIGFVQVRTDENLDADTPVEDFSVARIKRSLFEQSSVGLIYTRRAGKAVNGSPALKDRHTIGADVKLATSKFLVNKNLEFEGFLLWNTDPENRGTASFNDLSARGIRINYPNDLFDGHVSYREFGEAYDPAVGFVTRNSFRRVEPRIGFNPRPDFIPWIRQIKTWGQWRNLWDMSNRLVTRNIQYNLFEIIFEDGSNFELQLIRKFELLDEEFEIHDGIVLPAGEYKFNMWRISGWSAGHHPLSVQYIVSGGDFWSGEKKQYSFSFNYRPYPGIEIKSSIQYNDVTLPQGDFITNLFQFEGGVHLTPWSSFISSLQYDDVSEVIGLFSKFRWTVNPGNDIFLVYTQNWRNIGDSVWDFDTKLLSRGATSKINYTHRF